LRPCHHELPSGVVERHKEAFEHDAIAAETLRIITKHHRNLVLRPQLAKSR
jgi:hypothetical protein